MSGARSYAIGAIRLLWDVGTERMGESQVPFPYCAETSDAVHDVLSADRMARYLLRAGGDRDWALSIYLYNARLAKSLLFPLGAVEVAVRNAVDAVLVREYGVNWHQPGHFRDHVLSLGGQDTLQRAFERAGTSDRGQIIATLTFDFWSNIFRQEYTELWRTNIGVAFQHIEPGKGRKDIQTIVKRINKLRNRVAHHEPVIDFNMSEELSKLHELLGYVDPRVLTWVKHHTTVNSVLRTFPKRGSVVVCASKIADENFHEAEPATTLSRMSSCLVARRSPFIVLEGDTILGAILPEQFAEFVAAVALSQDGIIDLNDHRACDVLTHFAKDAATAILPIASPLKVAIEELTKARTRVLVLTCEAGTPVGVIARAHRRY